MKTTRMLLGMIMLSSTLFLSGCGRTEKYGAAVTSGAFTPIRQILSNPEHYRNTTVRISGTIVTECPAGCWFEVAEGPAVVYVDIAPAGLAIPQKVGKHVTVEGKILIKDRKVRMVGQGLEIK